MAENTLIPFDGLREWLTLIESHGELHKIEDASLQRLLDLRAVGVRRAADKGKGGQVASQPRAAADDDIGFGAGAPQPFTGMLGQSLEWGRVVHGRFTIL